jgi:hypothetical protein
MLLEEIRNPQLRKDFLAVAVIRFRELDAFSGGCLSCCEKPFKPPRHVPYSAEYYASMTITGGREESEWIDF